VTRFSLIVEGAGIVLLTPIFAFRYSADEALWHAVFHSISAYCNSGFSTFSSSLMEVADSPLALIVISFLVIIGGLGYLTVEELARWWRHARARRSGVVIRMRAPHRLSSHTWAVLVTSGSLLVIGFVLFGFFEWNDTLAPMSFPDKVVNAWFMSVTPRSSGFNTVDYGAVGNDTAALSIMLMFVGGSPGSTGGGVKTTTLAVLVALGLSRFRGQRFVALKHRAIPEGTVERTIGIVLLAMLVTVGAFFVLSSIESAGRTAAESREQFLPLAFETVSAFTTTGLSMNQTPHVTAAGKVVLIWLMFIGRVGLFSFFTAIVLKRGHTGSLRPAQEDVIVG
jgi:trk system potassium uptake protein TrkH